MNIKLSDLSQLEQPLLELEAKIKGMEMNPSQAMERAKLQKKLERGRLEFGKNLTDWQRCQLARHPRRPQTLDYINRICDRFEELHGDRRFGDDAAIIGGIAWIDGNPLMIIGNQKGRDTSQRIQRNFGQARPEGYRKALRLMKLAEKFRRPILTLIDTQGAYPGIEAEERGQAEAIARNLMEMSKLEVPVIAVVIGEGGSGGALALGVANRVLMLENAIYSVISPEGCASILWKDSTQAPTAATALKLTAPHLLRLGIIDGIIKEPTGGAHWDFDEAATNLKEVVIEAFGEMNGLRPQDLVDQRYQKFAKMGSIEY